MISAAGFLVDPTFLLHGKPDRYIRSSRMFGRKLRCIRTANGYMDRATFKMIMRDFFIPYVNNLKHDLEINRRADLVVDGHLSRYDIETFQMLDDAGIDLIILPAHSSHITQPLDITLNGLIKRAFPSAYRKGVPRVVLQQLEMERRIYPNQPILRAFPNKDDEETDTLARRLRANFIAQCTTADTDSDKIATRSGRKRASSTTQTAVSEAASDSVELTRPTKRKRVSSTQCMTTSSAGKKEPWRLRSAESGSRAVLEGGVRYFRCQLFRSKTEETPHSSFT